MAAPQTPNLRRSVRASVISSRASSPSSTPSSKSSKAKPRKAQKPAIVNEPTQPSGGLRKASSTSTFNLDDVEKQKFRTDSSDSDFELPPLQRDSAPKTYQTYHRGVDLAPPKPNSNASSFSIARDKSVAMSRASSPDSDFSLPGLEPNENLHALPALPPHENPLVADGMEFIQRWTQQLPRHYETDWEEGFAKDEGEGDDLLEDKDAMESLFSLGNMSCIATGPGKDILAPPVPNLTPPHHPVVAVNQPHLNLAPPHQTNRPLQNEDDVEMSSRDHTFAEPVANALRRRTPRQASPATLKHISDSPHRPNPPPNHPVHSPRIDLHVVERLDDISDQLAQLRLAQEHSANRAPPSAPVVAEPTTRRKREEKPYTRLNYAQMVYLKSDIRRFTQTLLGLPGKPLTCPNPEDLETFKRHQRGGPTEDAFTMDYRGPPGSPWNQEASQVFRDAFLIHQGHEHYQDEGPIIRFQFLRHFVDTLKVHYEKEHPTKPAEEMKEREDRKRERSSRDGRRYRLFQRRLKTCLNVVQLQAFVPLLQSLGYEGMSEDESGTEAVHSPQDVPRITNDGQKGYGILRSIWRNDDVIMPILRVIDQISISRKFSANGRPQKGNWPHVRIPTNRFSERKHLPERPLVVYRPSYIATLTPHQKEDLRIVPLLLQIPPIPEDVKREAQRFAHVRSSLDRPLPTASFPL
ncbi:hypothetical protein SISSUDRAFT_1067348 [Sistotremastrum suecicum HHB10207 ss-3]|uniref:Uncharacterized protein n=1 Tax=Sistotremastrum suecicum HHB10207 ss-3 TaxID=1314776 RepID=A0A165X832_9AGAM|nr:hypothetical protein SISSUDRAFT_1067348 [Sistotremastrum suecicum HHB10207 ss-3]